MSFEDRLYEALRINGELRDRISRERGRQDEINKTLAQLAIAIEEAERDVYLDGECVGLLQGLEAIYQEKFQKNLARIVSRGLTLVFEEPMELKIVTKVRADVTTVDFRLVQQYGEGEELETGLIGAKGGTVIVLLNVLLRILLVMSAHPTMARFLELDEPFGQADVDLIPSFGELLRNLAKKLGFQVIIVTHEKVLIDIGDTAYQVYRKRRGSNEASFQQLHGRNERVV